MNSQKKLGIIGSAINLASVVAFAICMLFKFDFGSYIVCIFLALSYAIMTGCFATECDENKKAFANTSMIFAGMYAVIILLVYFCQCTSVRLDNLDAEALNILNYSQKGLLFNYDMLGYAIMALSTFFVGLTIKTHNKADKWLKWLLIIHGVFFISCLIAPMLGLFSSTSENSYWFGVAVLEFWCLYFIPIGILSILHFKNSTL